MRSSLFGTNSRRSSLLRRAAWVTGTSGSRWEDVWSQAVRERLIGLGVQVEVVETVADARGVDLVVLSGPQRVQARWFRTAPVVAVLPDLRRPSQQETPGLRADLARQLQNTVSASDAVILPSSLIRDAIQALLPDFLSHAHVLRANLLDDVPVINDLARRADVIVPSATAITHPVFLTPSSGHDGPNELLRHAFDQLRGEADLLVLDRGAVSLPSGAPAPHTLAGLVAAPDLAGADAALLGGAAGHPVIAPDTPRFREITGEHAAFYDPGSIDQLVMAVRRILHAPRSIEAARLAGQTHYHAEFSPQAVDRKLREILESVGLTVDKPPPAGSGEALLPRSTPIDVPPRFPSAADDEHVTARPTIALLIVSDGSDMERLAITLASVRSQSHAAHTFVATPTHLPLLPLLLDRQASVLNTRGMADEHVRATLIELAEADYIAFLQPGDVLAPDALRDMVSAVRPGDNIVYSDEEIDTASGRSSHPLALKPGWSPELLHAYNYFGRLTAIRRDLARQEVWHTGRSGDAQDWDLNLRCADHAGRVRRVPRVLCRRSPGSTLDRPPPEDARSADHRAVLRDYWKRHGHDATVVTQANGTQHATWPLADAPLVSIIIPSRNKPDLIRTSVRGLLERTAYPNLEIIIVDNLTSDPEVLDFYDGLRASGRARIVAYGRPFNYSAACNAGAAVARGSLLLFLNNDIDVIRPDWLDELVRPALEPGVGVVGTMLVYPDGGLQHAGVVVGMHLCGLIFRAAPIEGWGIFGSPSVPRNYLAIMGACQLIRRDVFDLIGGFDETYRLCNSDVALSVKAWRAGHRTVYTPYARLTHREGASRGPGNPWEDMNRTAANMRELGVEEDPYFHPLLSPHLGIPTLRRDDEPTSASNFGADARRLFEETPGPTRLDIFSEGDVVSATGRSRDALFWPPQDPSGITDRWGAARYVLDLLRGRRDLRQRFPEALGQGTAGPFLAWLEADGAGGGPLTERARMAVRKLSGSNIGSRVGHVLLSDEHVRRTMPLGGTPAGRREFLQWLFAGGAERYHLRPEEVWWFALSSAEDPGAQVIARHLFTPAWQQAFPAGATVFGRQRLAAWLAQAFELDADWLDPSGWRTPLSATDQIRVAYAASDLWRTRHPEAFASAEAATRLLQWLNRAGSGLADDERAWLAGLDVAEIAATLAVRGVTLVGAFAAGQAGDGAEALARRLERHGIHVARRDAVRGAPGADAQLGDRLLFPALEAYPVTIMHAVPDEPVEEAYRRASLQPRRPATYRILFHDGPVAAAWEGASDLARGYDEVWAADADVAAQLGTHTGRPVMHMPLNPAGGEAARRRLDQLAGVGAAPAARHGQAVPA